MKKVRFEEKLESLVDEEEKKYRGRRFSTVDVSCRPASYTTCEHAEKETLSKLITLAKRKGADAYEITSLSVDNTQQEHDPIPYTARFTAILYKSK